VNTEFLLFLLRAYSFLIIFGCLVSFNSLPLYTIVQLAFISTFLYGLHGKNKNYLFAILGSTLTYFFMKFESSPLFAITFSSAPNILTYMYWSSLNPSPKENKSEAAEDLNGYNQENQYEVVGNKFSIINKFDISSLRVDPERKIAINTRCCADTGQVFSSTYQYRFIGNLVEWRLIEQSESVYNEFHQVVIDGVLLIESYTERYKERMFHLRTLQQEIDDIEDQLKWHKVTTPLFIFFIFKGERNAIDPFDLRKRIRTEIERINSGVKTALNFLNEREVIFYNDNNAYLKIQLPEEMNEQAKNEIHSFLSDLKVKTGITYDELISSEITINSLIVILDSIDVTAAA
jgi:hypothetical protein